MIITLSITILMESIVIIGFCLWRRKPLRSLLVTSICGNLITQFFLWTVLSIFFQHYLVTLLAAEILIWLSEGILLSVVSMNDLSLKDALLLSLAINLVSVSAGWLLPT